MNDLIWPNDKLQNATLRSSWRKNRVQQGMVGVVVGCLSPNHAAAASSEVHNILLVKIDDDLCIPISEKGVKEYKTITSPPLQRHTTAATTAPKNQGDEQEQPDPKDSKDDNVTL
jgi:hypothetical protein